MRITALVENQSKSEIKSVHGLALYIVTSDKKILFDVGPDNTLFENSEALGIDLLDVDTVVLSHGHYDHGGALEPFLKLNHKAKVYAQRKAFERHYSKSLFARKNVGIAPDLQTHPQVVILDGDHAITDELMLITTPNIEKFKSDANKVLYTDSGKDDFLHEQSLMILGETHVLFMGCGHAGIVNILEKTMQYRPQVCVGGYHLWNPKSKKTVGENLLDGIAQEMQKHKIRYYTCHCTGQKAFGYLAQRVPRMNYIYCGETIEL